jgi:hypothetical protein
MMCCSWIPNYSCSWYLTFIVHFTIWVIGCDTIPATLRLVWTKPCTLLVLNSWRKTTTWDRPRLLLCHPAPFWWWTIAFAKLFYTLNTSSSSYQATSLVEANKLVVAEACIQAFDIESTQGQVYDISSVKVSMLRPLLVILLFSWIHWVILWILLPN